MRTQQADVRFAANEECPHFQLQLVSPLTQSVSSCTPAVSMMCRASGGMASVPTRFMRATATERAAEPGAMMRALVMPRSPSVGVISQALVAASAVV